MPYIIGVPEHGAVVIGWEPQKRGSTEPYIRLTETDNRPHDQDAEDQLFFNALIQRMTQAKPGSIILEVVSQDKIDLEGDVQNASKYKRR
jgi:hypothetical protein